MKRLLACFLAGLLLLGCAACTNTAAPAAAETSAREMTAEDTSAALPETETTLETTTETTTQTRPATTTEKAVTSTEKAATTTKNITTTTTKKSTSTTTKAQNAVPKKYVGSKKSGELTWEQYQQARAEAQRLMQPYMSKSDEEKVRGAFTELRAMYDAGMTYSMEEPHYADPYGYLILKRASCAGSARTAGLCLDVMGFEWEHVNPNAFSHQWARVKVGGEYWICDPYGLYAGPEPAPYKHPHLE